LPVRGANLYQQLYVPVEVALNGGDVLTSYPFTGICRRCEGTGRHVRNPGCPACQGKGVESYQKSDTVRVPAGAWDGQRLVLTGEGYPGLHGGAAGDAVFSVAIVCGSDIQREGLNLTGSIHVDFVTATLGGTFEAKILGRDLSVAIPPNAQQGSVIRLPGHGLADGSGHRGELRLQIVLAMPVAAAHLTDEQRRALQAMFADATRRASAN
jgi:molecular chaperone DnaJ